MDTSWQSNRPITAGPSKNNECEDTSSDINAMDIYKDILEKNVSELPNIDLAIEFDRYTGDLPIEIAYKFDLTRKDLSYIRACECGGGLPHRSFFHFLKEEKVATEDLWETLQERNMNHLLSENVKTTMKEKDNLVDFNDNELNELADTYPGDNRNL